MLFGGKVGGVQRFPARRLLSVDDMPRQAFAGYWGLVGKGAVAKMMIGYFDPEHHHIEDVLYHMALEALELA